MNEELDRQRRKFLTGGMLPRMESQSQELVDQQPLDRQASHFERYSKNAMASEFELLLNLHQYRNAAESALASFAILDSIEDQMSIYRESSELSAINRLEANQSISVDQRLVEILKLALQINATTCGAFDITTSPLSRIWGFNRREGKVPADKEISEALDTVGMQFLILNEGDKSLRFEVEGVTLDLGGIGKGFAIDLAVEALLAAGINDFVLQGGQSSVAAAGKNIESKTDDNGSGWRIGLSHPTTPNCRIAEFDLVDQCLGTSGTQRQGFFYNGKRYGHIIDPRTGYPTDHCLSSTVICDKAAAADALATAFFVMQLEEVQEYCDKHPQVAAALVFPNNRSGVSLETFNCDKIAWRKLI